MLLRYSPRGIEKLELRTPATLIGKSHICDIVVENKHVNNNHALIEYNPVTKTYWIRQIGRKSYNSENVQSPNFDTQHQNNSNKLEELTFTFLIQTNSDKLTSSLKTIRTQKPVFKLLNYGEMLELKSADVLRFGDEEDSVDYVFEMPPILPYRNLVCGSPNSTSYTSKTKSLCYESSKNLEYEPIFLPIVGNKVYPKAYINQFQRPKEPQRRLCHLTNVNTAKISLQHETPVASLPFINSKKSKIKQEKILKDPPPPYFRSISVNRLEPITYSENNNKLTDTTSSDQSYSTSFTECCKEKCNRSVDHSEHSMGNKLLQRVVRLQDELQRRNVEITHLKQNSKKPSNITNTTKNNYILPNNHKGNREELQNKLSAAETHVYLTELIYDTFFNVCSDQTRQLNNLFSNSSHHDYSDMFMEIAKQFQEPFSYRLMPISKTFDDFLPFLKDAALMSRESVRACTVFSQWSREFGDQLQLQPNWDLMDYKIDDLQTRFRENGMSKHWLPPSVVPILKILIYEYRNQMETHNNIGNIIFIWAIFSKKTCQSATGHGS